MRLNCFRCTARFSRLKEEKTDLPLIRYYLDFYACQRCGDESALLTTEDVVGREFKARQEYQGAYKAKNQAATKLSVIMRWFQFREATKGAFTLVVAPRDRGALVFAVIAGLFLGIYYTQWCLKCYGYSNIKPR